MVNWYTYALPSIPLSAKRPRTIPMSNPHEYDYYRREKISTRYTGDVWCRAPISTWSAKSNVRLMNKAGVGFDPRVSGIKNALHIQRNPLQVSSMSLCSVVQWCNFKEGRAQGNA
eukprot:4815703-Pyramimonas_sp.AAC.1